MSKAKKTEDNLSRIVTSEVFEFVRRDDMPTAETLAKHLFENDVKSFEFPRGYVLRGRQYIENLYATACEYGCAFIFHRAKGLLPREVMKLCTAMGIPARLLDEDRVAVNHKGNPVNILDYPIPTDAELEDLA